MADVNKPKLQLRSGLSINGDKTPSPATKLLINHGKPNFTIQRSPKAQNGNANPLSPTPDAPAVLKANNNSNNNNNDEFVVKSTTFNGVFKPSNISAATKQTLQENGNSHSSTMNGNDNEAAKVVLRRAKVVQTETREAPEEDGNVPEFILRQRRIQERLANQNILDFENRRSGYFTQVMISPSSPNRQSFAETMASPAVKPGLEIPPPPTTQHEDIKEETAQEQQEHEQQELKEQQQQQAEVEKTVETVLHAEPFMLNGQDEEEEVAKAIAEVNKAVEGEDDDKTELEDPIENHFEETATTLEHAEETKPEEAEEKQQEEPAAVVAVVTSAAVQEEEVETPIVAAVVTSALEVAEEKPLAQQNGHVEAEVISAPLVADTTTATQSNAEEPAETLQNGHTPNGEALDNEITISHTNGLNGPTLPSPDPKGEKGVNFEPKTVVSFSQELGNNINKYPDTVKVHKDTETPEEDNELKELTKLKFEIKGDDKDIEVTPVLITETA